MVFSEIELQAIDDFEKEHLYCREDNNKNNSDCIGFTIHSDWTGIGVITTITCNACGETKDITDYDCW